MSHNNAQVEDLGTAETAYFQSALLYTTTTGERRIRVHTIAIPISININAILAGLDSQAIACLLSKMGLSSGTILFF
jgi:protein transport protein SEC24